MALADRKRRFGLQHKLARKGFKLAKDEYKFRKDQRDIATGIAGAGVLGAGAMGWMDILESRKRADRYDLMNNELMKRRLGRGVG
jgi:hypothetical protein